MKRLTLLLWLVLAAPAQAGVLHLRVGDAPVTRTLPAFSQSELWIRADDPFCEPAPGGWRCYRYGVTVRARTRGGNTVVRAQRDVSHKASVTLHYWR